MSADPAPLAFGEFRLDPANALLQRGAERLELPPKVFALLCHLAARPGQLVTKDELLDAVWGRRFVSESVLKTAVNTLRGALGDDPRTPRFVETVPRRGYRFLAVPATAAAAPAPARIEDAPPLWVARDAAEARLQEALAAVQAGGRQLVLLGGEAGIGKTTLVDRFCRAVSGSVALASGQCVEQVGGGEPLLPLLDALAALARGPEGALWVQAMRQCAPSWLARLPWLQPGGEAAPAPAAGEPERMLREFGALLDLRTPQRPLVLVVEDLHWSDHATVQLLGYLARRRGPARWLLLASYRPTDAALADHPLMALRLELRAQRLAAEIALDAFTEREVDGYLERRFAPAAVQDRAALARALQAHTEGLPLFVAAVVDELLQTGELAERGGAGWQLAADAWRRLAVPETIAGLVERQIARLPGPLRALLEAASVLGAEFAHDVLAALLDEPADALRARCDGLARRAEWLASAGMAERPGGRLAFRYAFRHALYQRVFYERAEPAQRLQHHRAAAQALLALAGHDDNHHAAELALHFERARDIATAAGAQVPQLAAEARRWRLAAARAAQALQAPADALAHYARVLEGAPEAAEAAAVLVERAELLRVTGQGEAALAEARRAIDLAQAAGDAALQAEARLALARTAVRCDRIPEGLAGAQALLASLPRADPRRLAVLQVQAEGLRRHGRLEAADAVLEEALQADAAAGGAQRAALLAERVDLHFQRGALAEGLALAAEARELHERQGQPAGAARMLIRVGTFAQALERRADAEAALLDARQRLARLHDVDGQRSAILNLAKLYSDAGDAGRTLAVLEEGWSLAPGFESPVAECAFLNGFYYCHYLEGELGKAFADAERVLAAAAGLQSLYWRVGSAIGVADLFIHLGELDTARRLLDDAVAQMHERGERGLYPRAMLRLAWTALRGGDAAGALARVAATRAEGPVEHLEDDAGLDRVQAEAQLAQGDAAGALATLARHAGAPTIEVWSLMLALRLQARGAPEDIEPALAAAQDRRLPALEGLRLRAALVRALRAAGRSAEAAEHAARHGAELERIAASLAGQPARQRALRAAGALPA